MPPSGPLIGELARQAHLGLALLHSTAARPRAPLKVNLCLTWRCQYRCTTCNIWQRRSEGELTAEEIAAFVRHNPGVTWADLTGGEIFLRPDIDEILEAVASGWKRLAILHFPTNGFLTRRIADSVRRISGRGPARTIVTVSTDGPEQLNDEIRGVAGGFRRQVETFEALRWIPGVTAVFGVTLSAANAGRFGETFEALRREVPGLTAHEVHVNVAQESDHYYGNAGAACVRPDAHAVAADLRVLRDLRKRLPRSPDEVLEGVYLRYLERFMATGRTPMPCHAFRASCFIDPSGVIFPCVAYSVPVGSLRDTGMRLEPIWQAQATARLQHGIWAGKCPQCWTACEAYQSILGNVLAGRLRRRPDATPCFVPDVARAVAPAVPPLAAADADAERDR